MWFIVCHWPHPQWSDVVRHPSTRVGLAETLTCLEMVEERPWTTKWWGRLNPGYRFCYKNIINHGCWQPVFFLSLRDVSRCHVSPSGTSRFKIVAMVRDGRIRQEYSQCTQDSLNFGIFFKSLCWLHRHRWGGTVLASTGSHGSRVGCKQPVINGVCT